MNVADIGSAYKSIADFKRLRTKIMSYEFPEPTRPCIVDGEEPQRRGSDTGDAARRASHQQRAREAGGAGGAGDAQNAEHHRHHRQPLQPRHLHREKAGAYGPTCGR